MTAPSRSVRTLIGVNASVRGASSAAGAWGVSCGLPGMWRPEPGNESLLRAPAAPLSCPRAPPAAARSLNRHDSASRAVVRSGQADTVAPTRKTVTVLFSDLSGSTALGERVDPESVRSLMSPLYASMRREVEDRGGTVIKFVGDGVMAVFGVPDVHEDDAMRALEAARGMQDALDRLSRDFTREYGRRPRRSSSASTPARSSSGRRRGLRRRLRERRRATRRRPRPARSLVGEETWRLTRTIATLERVAPLR